MPDLTLLTSKIYRLRNKIIQTTGQCPNEIHVSYDDFAELEDCLGIELHSIGDMFVVPNSRVSNGSCKVEIF